VHQILLYEVDAAVEYRNQEGIAYMYSIIDCKKEIELLIKEIENEKDNRIC